MQVSFLRPVVGVGKEQYWKLVRQMNGGTTKVLQGEDKDMEKKFSYSRKMNNSSVAAQGSRNISSIISRLHPN